MNSWCCHLAWLRENVHYSSLLSQPHVNTDLWTWLGTVPWFAQSSAATQHLKQHIKKNRWKFYLIEPTKPVHLNTISLVNQKNAFIVKEPASVCEVSNPARCLKDKTMSGQQPKVVTQWTNSVRGKQFSSPVWSSFSSLLFFFWVSIPVILTRLHLLTFKEIYLDVFKCYV